MVSNKVYQNPDYFSFIEDISKVWNIQKNNELALEYGLDKNTLPALVRLSRDWNVVFTSVREDLQDREKYISTLKNQIKILEAEIVALKNTDTQTIILDLEHQIKDLKVQRDEAEDMFLQLREDVEQTQKKKFFSLG